MADADSRQRSLEELIQAIDDDPDPMHLDVTPAVNALGAMGPEAVPPLLELLESEQQLTRLHAQRALEMIVYCRYGFEPGRGFPSAADEEAAREALVAAGYDFDAEPGERAAAAQRLRAWFEQAGAGR